MATIASGQTHSRQIPLHDHAGALRQELDKQIPIGSSLTDAREVLEANEFTCTMRRQESFLEMTDDQSVVDHNAIDFLFCEKRAHSLFSTRSWQVAAVHHNGVVSDLLTSVARSPVLRKKDYINMSDTMIRGVLLKFAPLGSPEEEVRRTLRELFHRGCKKSGGYSDVNPCPTCPREKIGFTLEAHLQHYDYLKNLFLSVNYVRAVWYFDDKGILKELQVTHEWDGV